MVNIVHTPTKKVARDLKDQSLSLQRWPKSAKPDSKKIVKKTIQPDSKLEVPAQPFDPDEEPMVGLWAKFRFEGRYPKTSGTSD